MDISLVQYNPTWKDKTGNLERIEKQISDHQSHTDLFLLPEMFATGFSMDAEGLSEEEGGVTSLWMKRVAEDYGSDIAGSMIFKQDGQYFNRFLYVTNDGSVFHYDKRHLFSMAGEDKIFTPGSSRVIVTRHGIRINLQVCYDLRFPEWARFNDDYDIILYTANWPTPRIDHWRALLIARAIENQTYVAAVNRIGNDPGDNIYPGRSMIIDPEGRVLSESVTDTEMILTANIDIDKVKEFRKRFPAWRDR